MKRKEVQTEVNLRLAKGEGQSAVFNAMSGQGVSNRVVAHIVASYADPILCRQYSGLIKAMIAIAWIQCAIAVLIGIGIGAKLGLWATLILTAFLFAVTYLFVWGFKGNKAWAYTATISLSGLNLSSQLKGFSQAPLSNTVGLLVGIGLIAFTCYVRSKLFPDLALVSPKKVRGTYSFSS